MPRFQEVVTSVAFTDYSGAGTRYLVETLGGVLYSVFIDANNDVAFSKSSDGGQTWSTPTVVFAGTAITVAVWYDRWSGIATDLIHMAYTDAGTDDTLYRTIDAAAADALSTQTVIFAGATTATGGQLSITRARGGNVYCRTCIDAGAEGGFFKLATADVPNGAWASRTINETLATQDQMILLPGFAADNQDLIGIFWDASADEISRQLNDDSGDSWAETSIATTMVDQAAATAFPHFDAFVDLANSRIVLVAWSAIDAANADLRCWTVTESAITEVTNVVLNSTDDQGLVAIALDISTNYWYVFYGGKSDGSETYNTLMNVYYKVSKDAGVTWGAETKVTNFPLPFIGSIYTTPRFTSRFCVTINAGGGGWALINIVPARASGAGFQLGL